MEDLDFDQLFADKMRQAGAPDISEVDWKPLSARLDAFDRKRHRVMPLWWLGALTGILFLSNLIWWTMWRNSSQKTEHLLTEWQVFQQQNILMQDTVVQKVVVYEYDTIRITAHSSSSQRYTLPINVSAHDDTGQFVEFLAPGALYQHKVTGSRVPSGFPGISNHASEDLSANMVASQQNPKTVSAGNNGKVVPVINTLSLPLLPLFLTHRAPRLPAQDLQITPQIVKKAPVVAMLRHSRWGFSTGTMQANAKTIAQSSGYVFGVAGEFPVSDHFSLTANADYSRVKLKGYVYDEGLGLPPLKLPGSEYDFVYFETHEGSKPVVNLGLGARYWFSPGKTWSPFFGAAYQAQWHPEYEIEMEYRNRDTGENKSKDVEISGSEKPLSMLDLNLGFRYRASTHVHLMAAGFYQIKLNPEKAGIPRYMGLKATFLYEL